eukprot:TRINITY_DN25023_c0_g1_i1.p1 TRINITY_DN25023_c0_g1~~TRINITY_DN25023_c0_g1_i1.p1  ORF type:complete len:796 (+),score=129.08 TRINITY_DN25023_c0_g1_i1:50-2389(+)
MNETIKADNQLFSRNNARFLRRLLRIAGEKKETMWYVKKVLEDAEATSVLQKHAPRDEMQYYQTIARLHGSSEPMELNVEDDDSSTHLVRPNRKDGRPSSAVERQSKKINTPVRPRTATPQPTPWADTPIHPSDMKSHKKRKEDRPRPHSSTGHRVQSPIPTPVPRPRSAENPPPYRRRESDTILLKKESSFIRQAAGMDVGEEPTAGMCWDKTTGILQKVRDMVDAVEHQVAENVDPDEPSGETFEIIWEQGLDGLPDVTPVSPVGSLSSGESAENPMEIDAKRKRQQHRRDSVLACKLREKQQNNAFNGLPYNTVETTPFTEAPMVVQPKPLKVINGFPAPVMESTTMKLSRRASLFGGSGVFMDGSVLEQREKRWGPCIAAFNGVEAIIAKLEAITSREGANDAMEHPPILGSKEKEAVLCEGLGSECDEVSTLLTKWGTDIEQRVKILMMREMIRSQMTGRTDMDTKHTQTDESRMGHTSQPPSKPTTPTKRRTGKSFQSLDEDDNPNVKRTNFQQIMLRITAAIRIQSVWRGHCDRVLAGDIPKGIITFFHSRDVRLREAWAACCRSPIVKPVTWLSQLVSTVLNLKITSNYVCDTQKKKRPELSVFLYDHLYESLLTKENVDACIEGILTMLDKYSGHDLIYSIFSNFLLGIWDVTYLNLLNTAMCCAHAVSAKLVEPNMINPACVLDIDVVFTRTQVKSIIKSTFKNSKRIPAIVDDVIKRCRMLKGRDDSSNVTQKELYYSMLITSTPDVLAEAGFDKQEKPGSPKAKSSR